MDQEEVNSINSDLIRGHIDTIILKALQAGDRYGYDIIKEIEHKSDGQYVIKQPTLYSCLKRLEVQGFVKSYWGSKSIGGRKKYFTLTDLGRELFLRNKNDWDYSRDVINKLISDEDYSTDYGYNSEYYAANDSEIINADKFSIEFSEALPQVEDNIQNEPISDELENVPLSEFENSVEEVLETKNESEDALPLSVAEQTVGNNDDFVLDIDNSDLLNKIYDEQAQESYFSNVDNAQYEPSQADPIDVNDYFSDTTTEEYDNDDEVASATLTAEKTEEPYCDAKILPPDEPVEPTTIEEPFCDAKILPPDEDVTTFRRVVNNDTPSETKTVFYSYKRTVPDIDENTAILDKEYRGIINKMISDNVITSEPPQKVTADDKIDYASAEYFRLPPEPEMAPETPPTLNEINMVQPDSVSNSSEDITIRTHNDKTLREYNNKRYYYSNQLRLLQFGILFGIMILEIAICFYFIEVVHNKLNITTANLALYIIAVIITASFPIAAFISASRDFYKRKRINYSAKSSLIFSFAAFVLLSLITFFSNIYAGILISDINLFLSALIMPIVLSTNVMVNALIFHLLYTSGRYNI